MHDACCQPLFLPRQGGGWLEVFWLPVIFGFFIFVPVQHLFVGVGWFVFGWVLGFSRPVSAETFFVESLILAQDERWRRA